MGRCSLQLDQFKPVPGTSSAGDNSRDAIALSPSKLFNFRVLKLLYTFLHLLYLLKADWILGKWASEKDTPLSCKCPQKGKS